MEEYLPPKDELVCPYCKAYFSYEPTDDKITCPICNNKISEEDLEDVFAEDTAGDGQKTISA